MNDDLVLQRRQRLRDALLDAPYDGLIAGTPANVAYATGYRSVGADLFRTHQMAAVIAPERTLLVAPVADSAPAIDGGVVPDDIVAYGRFYFESADDPPARPTELVDTHPGFVEALRSAVEHQGLATARLGVDVTGLTAHWPSVHAALATATLTEAASTFFAARAVKLPGEVDRLRQAAQLAEAGIDRAIAAIAPGVTEQELAALVASAMVEGGGAPRFVVVAAGLRSALADAAPTTNAVRPGDLVRFDVGCIVDGYWSDMARTAVLGAPTASQQSRYGALLAGEQAQLDALRPGISAQDLFDVAVETVEKAPGNLTPYRRHHCGHGIGSEVYEPPIIAPGSDTPLEAGMTFSVETPFYELGWGGMMVEDTLVVTADGHDRFTTSDRSLRVMPA